MQAMACVRRAGLASGSRAFSTILLCPQQWSSASLELPQNVDSVALKTFLNGKSSHRSQELISSHKFYSTDASATLQMPEEIQEASTKDKIPELQALNGEEEEATLPGLHKTDETLETKKQELFEVAREMCRVLDKGDEDMEETLTQLGVQLTPQLANMVLDKTSSLSSSLRFFQWAKLQPGFKHNTSTYGRLVNIVGCSKDFETLQMILVDMLAAHCNYSVKTFSFAAAWHDDPDMLNELMEMFGKLAFFIRRNAYEMLIAALCQGNHINAALVALEKMASADCAPRMRVYRPLIQVYCQNNQMDKVKEIFEMMKDCPQDFICYHIVLSALCNRKQFAEAVEFLRRMVNMGCKPDAITYDIMIRAACNLGRIQSALQLFDRSKEEGITPLDTSYGHILEGFFQIEGFDGANSFLIQHSEKDRKLGSSIYNHFIRVCSKSGQEQRARNLMMEMKAKGFY